MYILVAFIYILIAVFMTLSCVRVVGWSIKTGIILGLLWPLLAASLILLVIAEAIFSLCDNFSNNSRR